MRCAGQRHAIRTLLLLVCCAWQASAALAGTSIIIQRSQSTIKPLTSGLRLTLTCDWVESPGYHPVRIDVACTTAAAADRTLHVEVSTVAWMNDRKIVTAAADVEIPAGSVNVSKVLSLPRYATHPKLALDVWEDGIHLDDLSTENITAPNAGMGFWDTSAPSILFVSAGAVDVSQFGFLTANSSNTARLGGNPPALNIPQIPTFLSYPAANLVENWINYSSFDVIFLSLADAENLAANRPRVWHALRQWTWAGGNLCVFGAGDDWHGLASLEQLLQCPATADEAKDPHRGWNAPADELFDVNLNGTGNLVSNLPMEVDANGNAMPPATPPKRPEVAPCLIKRAMLGQVVAIASANPYQGHRTVWNWMFNAIGPDRWRWQYRHGVTPDRDNPDFDNFLIADIGLPPVKTYRVLITLFVIVIGPLNYWFLRRNGRLHLLLFTVPLAAFLASGGLIGYAVLADGFESRIRARSFTAIDQRNHQAVCWSRLSYYTGLAPSGGLVFPDDTILIPLERNESAGAFGGGRQRRVAWVPEQHFARGWLNSRTPTQYLTVRASANSRELKIQAAADKQQGTIENRLGVHIQYLFLRDAEGQFHFEGPIPAGKTIRSHALASGEATDAAGLKVKTALLRNQPTLPSQVPSGSKGGIFPARPVRFAFRNAGPQTGTSSSILERELDQASSAILSKSLPPRTYVAIVDHPTEVTYGLDGLVESQSVHVILGTW